MSNETESEPKTRFPTFRRLFTWKMARRALIVFAVLATLAALFYAEENFRGKRAWDKYRAELEAQGVQLDLAAFVPPQVPDDENFAMTPFLAPLTDFNPPGTGQGHWRDTNGFQRASGFRLTDQNYRVQEMNRLYWHVGGRTDLEAWAKYFRESTNLPLPEVVGGAAETTLLALTKYSSVLEELRQASGRPFARFNIRYDAKNPAGILLPHCVVLRNCVQILDLRAVANLSLDRSDEALHDLQLMFYLADTGTADPFLITQLVRITNLNQCLRVIWEGLSDHQ